MKNTYLHFNIQHYPKFLNFILTSCIVFLFCCIYTESVFGQNTPIYPLTCPSGTSIYTIDHEDLTQGSLPGGFYVETELSGSLSGSQSTANYTVLNGAFVNTPNFIADGGALTFTATNDGDDADLLYTFCQPVTNPYIIIGPTGPEIGTVYSIFESDGTTPINVIYVDGQTGFIVQNGNEVTTTINNQAGYVQIQDNTPRTSFIINIINGGTGGADAFDIGIGVCMPDPPASGNIACPVDLYFWENSNSHTPIFRDANGVYYEKNSPNSIGDALFTNSPLCGQVCLVETNYSIGDCREDTNITCNDNIDNDGDGLIDCDDPDCDLLANCIPICPLTVVEITPRCPNTDGMVTTRYWTPTTVPAACCFTTNGGIPQEDIFTPFSDIDGVTGLPLHQNGQSTSQVLLMELGVEDENIPGNVSGNMPNSNEQALQDCWLVVPEGVKCFELEIGGPRDEASAFYVGSGINSLVLLGTNLNGSDTYNVTIPCDAMTTTCGHSILRVRLYHHDSGNRSNSRVRWNIGSGFEEIPAKWLQSISLPDTDADKPTDDTPDPNQSYLAVQDANGDLFEARPNFGGGANPDEPIHHPGACVDIAPANCPTVDPVLCQQVISICCMLEVTCPPPSLGTISCNDPIPPAATNEAEFEALGGDIDDDPGPCGTLVITHQDVFTPPSPICDGRMMTRTYTIMDDNTTVTCTQTLTITPPSGPTIQCPADMTVQCFSDIVVNANDATATTDCGLGVTFTVSAPVQVGDDDCPGTTYTYTYTAEDECGRTDECEQVFTIQNDPPVIVCPPDMTVQCEADIVVDASNAMVTPSCNLGFVVWVDQPHITGARDCDGTTYEYTYHALDDCGRNSTCIQTFTLQNDPPMITCIPGETVECFDDIEVSPSDATVTTSCGEDLEVTIYSPVINGEPNCPGTTYTYTYRVEDQCEREATCDRVFTIGDNAAPTIVAPDDVTCNCLAGVTPNTANAMVTTACDNGFEVSLSGPVVSGPQDCPGTIYTYTYTVMDNCGRQAMDTQTFTIQNDGPQFVNAPTVPLQLNCEDEGWEYIIQAWLASVEATNSCGTPLTVFNNYNPNSQGLCISNGTTTVTFSATDQCGRTSTTTGMIIIADTEPPVFAEEAQDELDICNYNTPHEFDDWVDEHGNAQALDGCWGDNLSWSTIPNNPSFPSCMGMMGSTSVTVTFVARDGCGNKASTTATFTALMTGGDLVENEEGDIQSVNEHSFVLYQNQPNPFKNETMISFNLPEASAASLTVYDISGKVVTLVKGDYSAGYNQVLISRSDLKGAGMFYYEIKTASHSAVKKMIILD